MPCDSIKTSEIEHVDWSTGSGHPYSNVRFGSGSSQASQSSGDICRICHCESDPQNPLLTPCYCAGSLKYVHQACLQQWLTASETNSCELCKFPFIMHTKIKPFNEWRSLDISGIERRRLCCSVLFHCAAALCVIWSLCVLIERAADDVQRGLIDWPFWTKLAVVTVGLTGGVVFMYIQCKAYLHLCHRWKARNRILLIQNAPEKVHPLSPPSPVGQNRSRHGLGASETRSLNTHAASGSSGNAGANVGNQAPTTIAYNYATAAGNSADGAVEIDGVAAAGMHHYNHHHHLPASPHHMLQQADLDLMAPRSSAHQPHQHLVPQNQIGQVAVSANIESQSQHNYERDWALDDVVSQISSFRPCPQGSGSMTPFHDSIHNVLEHSESSSRGSVNDVCGVSRQDLSTGGISTDTGREHALQLDSFSGSGEQRAPSISSGVSNAVANGLGGFVYKPHPKRYSNSSIFLENRDILDDSVALGMEHADDYPKINYRHSSILTPPPDGCCDDPLDSYLGKDVRRYSDTKLLGSTEAEAYDPMLATTTTTITTNAACDANSKHMHQLLKQHSDSAADTVLDMPCYVGQRAPPTLYRSLHTVEMGYAAAAAAADNVHATNANRCNIQTTATQGDKARLFFKSLPNLSSSCESLIKK